MQRFAQGYLFFKFPQRRNVWNSWHFDVANAWYDGSNFSFQHISFYFFSITVFVPWNEIYDLGQSVERFVRKLSLVLRLSPHYIIFLRNTFTTCTFHPNLLEPPLQMKRYTLLPIHITKKFQFRTLFLIHPNKK